MCAGTGAQANSGSIRSPLAYNNGFSAKELNRIRKKILENLDFILEAWNEHCGES